MYLQVLTLCKVLWRLQTLKEGVVVLIFVGALSLLRQVGWKFL